MEIVYKKADINDIENLINLKIKQSIYNCSKKGMLLENEGIARENIHRVLLQELNKTIYFFIAIDKQTNKAVACNGVIIHQMVPSPLFLNGKKAYITSVYTEEAYRCHGIQNILMKMNLAFLLENNCQKIELDADNPHAIKLYQKFGFQKHDEKYILNCKNK